MASLLLFILYCFLLLCFAVIVLLFLLTVDPKYGMPGPRVIYNTLGRDIKAGLKFSKVRMFLAWCHSRNKTTSSLFQSVVKKYPDKICFIYEDQKWSFQQVEDYSNQVANYFHSDGFQKGDEVALFMENRPQYAAIWLGLSKIGVIPALINTNLRTHSLAHSINVIACKGIIFGTPLNSAVQEVIPYLENKKIIKLYNLGNDESPFLFPVKLLNIVLREVSSKPPDEKKHKINFTDKLLYIYTSGTTGLPKAAIIRHSRMLWIAAGARYMMSLKDSDVFYNPLPMYHTAGGMLFLSTVLTFGGTMVIKKKFSASNFWQDAIKYEATVSQYIGETCRYLLVQPEKPQDREHKIKLMCGNGLRPQIWKEFIERFKIKRIIEIYGSTEGNANTMNTTNKIGAVGFISRIFARIHPVCLIKVDPETGEPIRDKAGLCIRCKPGEPGEMVGKIVRNNPVSSFDGYANAEATRKKIVQNCFEKGDLAFLSGDILTMDEDGYLYFLDRTGDTYRWHGENVSTSEVESVISKVMGLVDCVVYGVQVPGLEGRAGMVAVQSTTKNFDLQSFYREISKVLPSYAIPVFLRICKDIETTGTYKLQKMDLQKDRYNPGKTKDPLFFLEPKTHSYVKLDQEIYKLIEAGNFRI